MKNKVTTKKYKTIPPGSSISIIKENKKSYRGYWSSMYGTYTVTIPKTHFEKPVSKHTAKQREYYENNREAWNKYQREYKKRRYANDAEYRARMKEYQREWTKQNRD